MRKTLRMNEETINGIGGDVDNDRDGVAISFGVDSHRNGFILVMSNEKADELERMLYWYRKGTPPPIDGSW